MDQVGDHNDDRNWLDEIALKEAIRGPQRPGEAQTLNLRFFKGMTRIEVSTEIGISSGPGHPPAKGRPGPDQKTDINPTKSGSLEAPAFSAIGKVAMYFSGLHTPPGLSIHNFPISKGYSFF